MICYLSFFVILFILYFNFLFSTGILNYDLMLIQKSYTHVSVNNGLVFWISHWFSRPHVGMHRHKVSLIRWSFWWTWKATTNCPFLDLTGKIWSFYWETNFSISALLGTVSTIWTIWITKRWPDVQLSFESPQTNIIRFPIFFINFTFSFWIQILLFLLWHII